MFSYKDLLKSEGGKTMGSVKALTLKKQIVSEITDKLKSSSAIIFFDYLGLTVSEMTELRRKMKDADADIRIYKNSLTKRALDSLSLKDDFNLMGPHALSFSSNIVEPIKIITNYAKDHPRLVLKKGIVEGNFISVPSILELALIPSREGLLTMLAAGMLEIVRDLSICLHLVSELKDN